MYQIEIVSEAIEELRNTSVFYRRLLVAAIEAQLKHEPTKKTRNRKCLSSLVPSFEHEPPVWELRVQDWRVFYDVDEDQRIVSIRAVREKPKGKLTGEIV
ncbi:MAG: type II toxin-antitoxin system RelE/ParE family toxin [Deltaproteobacteria bacterium]|nr:type II toxin-antitoxin system RelE/ParE family toxin [Deltaproteobacteria bacterium]